MRSGVRIRGRKGRCTWLCDPTHLAWLVSEIDPVRALRTGSISLTHGARPWGSSAVVSRGGEG